MSTGVLPVYADSVVENGEKVMEKVTGEHVEINAGGVLKLTSSTPLEDATINLNGTSASLIFESLMCSEIESGYLDKITINGKAFDPATDRLSIYGNGAEIIPSGWTEPLTIYDGENLSGNSMVCQRDIYYRGQLITKSKSYLTQEKLGAFDNSIRSFKLKRGYSATFANNSDGTGYSRVFTATDADLEINEMPDGLEFASFIRVCRADRIGKKGICGLSVTPITRSAWYYSWGASDESQQDFEFIPMRHNMWWDGWDKIGSRTDASQLLGYNEPDHADQSDLSPDYAISEWPNFMMSGLRVGSPAPDQIRKDWLTRFMATADSLNYRVDFVATHMYWNSQTPEGLCKQINELCAGTYGGRPMWITEWNNGANWTSEWWPDQKGPCRDADFNIILTKENKDSIVSRPHTEANSAIQAEWLAKILPAFDECKWLERHSFYNWVEDARSVVINDKLTPAGKVFAAHNSVPAFSREREYVHKWRIAPPFPKLVHYSTYMKLTFTDHNGETGEEYYIQRRIDGGKWETIDTLVRDVDYKTAKTVSYTIKYDLGGKHEYRVLAKSYKGTYSKCSRIVGAQVEATGVSAPEAAATFGVRVAGGTLYVASAEGGNYSLYRPDGRLMRTIAVEPEGETAVYDLPRGMYIINGTKIVL